MSGWSRSGGGARFGFYCFVLFCLKNARLQNLHGLAVVFCVLVRCG